MPNSDDFGFDDDDSAFIAAATQVEATQQPAGFAASPRPAKRRRLGQAPDQLDGPGSDISDFSVTDDEAQANNEEPYSRSGSPDKSGGATEDEYYFPEEMSQDEDKSAKKNSKYKIHVPKNAEQYQDQFFTQTQANLDSSPGHFRGPVWKKPVPPPPPAFNAVANRANGNNVPQQAQRRLPASNSFNGQNKISGMFNRTRPVETDEQMAARLQREENDLGISRPKPLGERSVNPFDATNELADLPSDAFSSSSPEKSPTKGFVTITSSQPGPMDPPPRPQGIRAPTTGLKQMTIFGQAATQQMTASQAATKKHSWPLKAREEPPTHHKLNPDNLTTWVYPTNLGSIRDYQFNIVSRSLFHNTLVALPTGLGKTFIAATVMLNYFRWTKESQIIFMAPTKPLIAQQMDACYKIVGIPRDDTVLMTGETSPAIRAEEWLEKRVFFMTPQTVINDLKHGVCDPKKLVLLVVDEAHKATGGYAYTEVISFVRRFNSSFRVLALTATPGSNVEAVQAVIDNLDIARVELRTEQSLDIVNYTHEKHTETELFDYNEEQSVIMEHMSKALKPTLEKLNTQNAYWAKDPMQLTAYGLTMARQKWAGSDAGRKSTQGVKGMVQAAFLVLSSLAHSISLLKNHGIGPFYSGIAEFQRNVDSGQSKGKTAKSIAQSEDFVKMTGLIRGWTNNPDFIGHPKLEYLRQVVLNHFLDAGEGRQGSDVPPSATRVMVFASYRDSTEEICRVLKRNEPMIRPHVFVGQAEKNGSDGMNQKKQNEVVQDFKSGKYNTLVATSIGEEGLDIGDVDLIVCYDASSSPIRMLQRIGRTGRKRVGKVSLLLMRGKEENDYTKAQDNYLYIQKSIADDSKYNYHDDKSPRIVPKEIQPVVDKRPIDIPPENSQPVDLNEKNRKARGRAKAKRPPKKFHMPDGVRTGFVKASKMGSDQEDDEPPPAKKTKAPAKACSKAAAKSTATTTAKAPAKKKTASAASKTAAAPPPLPDVAQLPFLGDVLLNEFQQRELVRKYAQTSNGDADLIVRAPDVFRFPRALQELGTTKYVRHGSVTQATSKVMKAMQAIDDNQVADMKNMFRSEYLVDAGPAKGRLASPPVALPSLDMDELPEAPLPVLAPKKAPARPRKRVAPKRTVSAPIVPEETPARPPPKKRAIRRSVSYGSVAGEGDESSPEPTPANMRIGTQGIDLGSDDTSGEDEEEEPDSELEAFVARSDDVIEMASSSQPLSQRMSQRKPKPRGLKNKNKQALNRLMIIDSDDGDGADPIAATDDEMEEPAPKVLGRRKRVVDDSDESE